MQLVRFIETPNGPVLIAEAEQSVVLDDRSSRKLRTTLSVALGGIPVLLRCRIGTSVTLTGEPHLKRYAADPAVDLLPPVGIDLAPLLDRAA